MTPKARHIAVAIVGRVAFICLMFLAFYFAWFWLPAARRCHIEEEYTFAAKSGGNVALAVMIPKTGPYQTITNVSIQWNGAQDRKSYPQADVIELAGRINQGSNMCRAVISFDVFLRQEAARWSGPVEAFQTGPQADIESDASSIARQAALIAPGHTRADARAIWNWTAGYLVWPKGSRYATNQSALTALQTRVGVCGDFANLMSALSRASGIPCQSISGLLLRSTVPYWTVKTTWGHAGGAHAWVEFHSDAGWELADPSFASGLPAGFRGCWFGRNDAAHLSYGEIGAHQRTMDAMDAWAKQHGRFIGGMSAPLKFSASTDADGVLITPRTTFRSGWDARWTGLLVVMALCSAWARVGGKLEKQRWQALKQVKPNAQGAL